MHIVHFLFESGSSVAYYKKLYTFAMATVTIIYFYEDTLKAAEYFPWKLFLEYQIS